MENEKRDLINMRYPRLFNHKSEEQPVFQRVAGLMKSEKKSAGLISPCVKIAALLQQADQADQNKWPVFKKGLMSYVSEWRELKPDLKTEDILFRLLRSCICVQGYEELRDCKPVDLKTCVEYPKYLPQLRLGVRPQDTFMPRRVSFLLDVIDTQNHGVLPQGQLLRLNALIGDFAKSCAKLSKDTLPLARSVCTRFIDFMSKRADSFMPAAALEKPTSEWDAELKRYYNSKIKVSDMAVSPQKMAIRQSYLNISQDRTRS